MEEMQGIMSLPGQGSAPSISPDQMAIFDQMKQQIPPKEFGDALLSAGAQKDPQTVKAFIDELRALEVPIDTLIMLNEMVDLILANPRDYGSLRREYMRRGVTEDLLPEKFDPIFFGALNMALDQLTAQEPQEPAQMAQGGIASLAKYGRHGDTMLAHITPDEAAMLKRMGGAGTTNPVTGLPEYGNIFSNIGKAIKKFASSTVGKIITTVALGFFLGPAAAGMLGVTSTAGVAAVSGFIGGAGSTLLAGGNLKQALTAGAIGGLTAGAGAGIMGGGADAFASGSYTGPTTVGGQFDRLMGTTPTPSANISPPAPESLVQGPQPNINLATEAANVDVGALAADELSSFPMNTGSGSYVNGQFRPDMGPPPPMSAGPAPELGEPIARRVDVTNPDAYRAPVPTQAGQAPAPIAREPQVRLGSPTGEEISYSKYQTMDLPDRASGQTSTSLMDKAKGLYKEYMPESLGGSRGAIPAKVLEEAKTAYTTELASSKSPFLAKQAYDAVIKAGTPGMLSTYGPLALAGLGLTAAAGGFETKPATMPLGPQKTGRDYINEFPDRYRLSFGGLGGARPNYNPYSPRGMAEGGIAALEMGGKVYPRKTGPINGPGTGTSDSIPALLSDGEFVFTAKAVRAMGNGSRRKGAKRLYTLMKALEKKHG